MISQKLRTIFLLAVALFVVHGIEEFLTGFYNIDWLFLLVFGKLGSSLAQTFIIYQLVLWALLGLSYVLVIRGKGTRILSSIIGVIMLLELQHLYEVAVTGKYYPGAYTAILFPIIGFLFWKELIKEYKKYEL